MDVTRLPEDVSESALKFQSTQAVQTIHNSMVALRKELVKKNKKIEELEKLLQSTSNGSSNTRAFEDMFDLEGGKTSKEVNFDQILLYEDEMNADKVEEQRTEPKSKVKSYDMQNDSSEVVEDPIMEFVLSDSEDSKTDGKAKVGHLQDHKSSTVSLVVNEDVLIHHTEPPKRKVPYSKSKEFQQQMQVNGPTLRPILKDSSATNRQLSVSSSGSQTDITAVVEGYHRQHGRWMSEPHLNRSKDHSQYSRPSSVSFSDEIDHRTHVGRYSILNRDFSLKNANKMGKSPDTGITMHSSHSYEASQEIVHFMSGLHLGNQRQDDNDDTDKILAEAKTFVDVALRKFITLKDWSDIQTTSPTTRKSPSFPYVPYEEKDLGMGNVVRAIGPGGNLVRATIKYLDKDVVGLEPSEGLAQGAVDDSWKQFFISESGHGFMTKLDKIVMVLQ